MLFLKNLIPSVILGVGPWRFKCWSSLSAREPSGGLQNATFLLEGRNCIYYFQALKSLCGVPEGCTDFRFSPLIFFSRVTVHLQYLKAVQSTIREKRFKMIGSGRSEMPLEVAESEFIVNDEVRLFPGGEKGAGMWA